MSTGLNSGDAANKFTGSSLPQTPKSSSRKASTALSSPERTPKKLKTTHHGAKNNGTTTDQSTLEAPSHTPRHSHTPLSPYSPHTPPQKLIGEDELFRRLEILRYEKRECRSFIPMDSDESEDDKNMKEVPVGNKKEKRSLTW